MVVEPPALRAELLSYIDVASLLSPGFPVGPQQTDQLLEPLHRPRPGLRQVFIVVSKDQVEVPAGEVGGQLHLQLLPRSL